MTAEAIIDGAMKLTAERGLENWSTRMLAGKLNTSLSVIAHHVGDLQALSAAVVDRVATDISVPDDSLPWQSWLRELLVEIRRTFQPYPGVAQWALHHGPTTPAIAPILDRGVTVLADAGFGDRAPQAYTVAATTALSLIAVADARRTAGTPHQQIAAALHNHAPRDHSGLSALSIMVDGFAKDGVADHFLFTVGVIIAGLEAL